MKYLNADGLTNLAMIGYMAGVLEDVRKRVGGEEWNTETRRTVSQAATWANKAYLQMCQELDPKQGQALSRRLQSWKGAKLDIIRPSLTRTQEVEIQQIEKNDFYDILEHIISGGCTRCLDPGTCRFKELLLKYDVPISNNDRECPYWNEPGEKGKVS